MSQATSAEEYGETVSRMESLRRWSMREQATANECKCVGQFVCRRCKEQVMTTEEMQVVGMMRTYGGSFVKAMAHAMLLADAVNFAVLRDAFPIYWRHYAALKAEGQQQIDQALRKPE